MYGVQTESRAKRASVDKFADWLLGSRVDAPEPIAAQLRHGLFSSVPIFLGGVINTIVIAALAAWLYPSPFTTAWVALELAVGLLRVGVLVIGRRAIVADQTPPRMLAALLSCVWAGSVGYGTVVALIGGNWVLSVICCLSASAMVCGICLRNYGTPRLAAIMVALVLAPCAVAGLLTVEPVLIIISLQLPVYMVTIFSASFSLHGLMVSRMTALDDLQRSKTLNETILRSSPDYTLILDADRKVIFCNRPGADPDEITSLMGRDWLTLLPVENRTEGMRLFEAVCAGASGNLVTHYTYGEQGSRRWFDVLANSISDGSGRVMVVARDITHQKESEEHALWMAQHDALTGLPNRSLLQKRLDAMLGGIMPCTGALLLVDVDNFKTINDTLGHDAGDALLCTFASRLLAAVSEEDLVARTGGDEFSIILATASETMVEDAAQRIFEQLRQPFCHEGRLLECGASIGASVIPRDGRTRSEIMKAADIALYAAKTGGRARMMMFEPSMMLEVERHQAMIVSARQALQNGSIVPYYQPKISLRSRRITGFEALLRWKDGDEHLRGPDVLKAAFDDPALSGPLSDRMLDAVLEDVRQWLHQGLAFGHVAINVAASDFRRGGFADSLLSRLAAQGVPASCIQIEVTETVFLGRGAGYVEEALKHLSSQGIRIALDDFGTGYASLSHLNQFPVDLLKIDRSFIHDIGLRPDADAISTTVINLGHCLGLEVIAEGIETQAQEAHLAAAGCDTGQGFLYSEAVPAHLAGQMLRNQDAPAANELRA